MGSPNFEIIAGTYEEYLLGYNFIAEQSKIVQSFAAHDHSSSIRSLCISGHYLATGSSDDRIIVYDLKSRKEHCMLTHHDATVSCLQFTANHSHLLSASSDGVLAIVRVGNWQVEKIWAKAHKGSAILDIAIHSSGKLALTLGADCTLRTWNLIKGRQAYAVNLNSKCKDAKSLEKIIWAADGTRFILTGGKYTEVWSIETGGILKVIEHDEKVCSCIWFSKNKILIGYENGQMVLVKISDLTKSLHKAHEGRVKVLALHEDWVVSGSSTGEVKVWDRELKEVAKLDSGCRLTCLGIVPLIKIKEEKILEDVAEQAVRDPVMSKSIVIMETESDNDENIVHFQEVKNKQKQEIVTIEVNGDDAEKPSKRKKKKKKMEQASEETNALRQPEDISLEEIGSLQVEKKTKKEKRKRKSSLGKDKAKQETEIITLKAPYMGCGRKRKEIIQFKINGKDAPKRKRTRKPEEPIKTEMIEDGQPRLITPRESIALRKERKKIMKQRKREKDAYMEEVRQKMENNNKLMGSYMGCGRKRKEIFKTKVNEDENSKKIRRRKLEKPIKKDTSVNHQRITLSELFERHSKEAERVKKERKEKRRLKNMCTKKRRKVQ